MNAHSCGYLGCHLPAEWLITEPYDVDRYRCTQHASLAYEVASKFANRQTHGAKIQALR